MTFLQDKKLTYILAGVSLFAVLTVGWVVWRKAAKESIVKMPVSSEVVDVQKATKETNKTVLEETKTASGQTLKAVSGKLVSVEGQTLILESDGDRVRLLVSPDAKITRTTFLADRTNPPRTEVVSLADLKVGDRVDALAKTQDGTTMATSVNVIVVP